MAKVIRMDGEIGFNIYADELADQIKGEKDIELIINSRGGSILEGFAIYNVLKDFEGTITARIDLAASMASVIAMAADKIVMRSTSSLLMIHKPWTCACGEAEDLRQIADTLDKLEGMISSIYLERVSDSVDDTELEQMLSAETWLDGAEALELGFADELAENDVKNMLTTVLSAMDEKHKVAYDLSKLAAKVKQIESGERRDLKAKLKGSQSLSDIEAVLRNAFDASRPEVTAIVSSIKALSIGDHAKGSAENSAKLNNIFQKHMIKGD